MPIGKKDCKGKIRKLKMSDDNLSTKTMYKSKSTSINNINLFIGGQKNNGKLVINTNRGKSIMQELYGDNDEVMDDKEITIKKSFDNFFKYNNIELLILNIDDEIWFKGKEIAKILGYSDQNQVLKNNFNDSFKKSYEQ